MKTKFVSFLAAMAILCSVQGWTEDRKIIKVDGSSTVYPITEAVAEEFQQANSSIKVTVGISGTGGGFKKFCRGETDISNASRPILRKEMDACLEAGVQYVELPVAFDALTVVVNPKNTWVDTLTVAELKKLWEPAAQTVVTTWNKAKSNWPAKPLKLYGPGADSGTFDYFTEAVVGKAKSSRGDYTASEDDNVLVQGVANDEGALGYFGLAYYLENKDRVKAVKIEGGAGAVLPSEETVKNGTYRPLSRPVFIYVSKKAMKKPEVKSFVEFYLKNAGELASQAGYVGLPRDVYHQALSRFQAGTAGTAFNGEAQSGVPIAEIMQRKPKL